MKEMPPMRAAVEMPEASRAAPAAWAPLRWPVFRSLWIAALVSNIGTWMQDVGASWLMATLTPSPVLIASVQAATTLPIFLLALVAGALADVVDRRRLLLVTQAWMLVASGALGLLAVAGLVNAPVLLAATFVLGLGAALNAPAWQAIIPELVAREELASAVTLNGAGINLARTVGPALGGFVVASIGPGAAFLLNAVSFLGVVLVLFSWRRTPRASLLPAETLLGAVRAGVRYARHAEGLRSVLTRAAAFIVCGSALWALLPVLVKYEMGRGAADYGLLLGWLGIGAVGGAILLPRLRRGLRPETQVAAGTILMAAVLATLAFERNLAGLSLALAAAGVAWITLLTTFHTSAQLSLAAWVRGRGLAVYLLVFFGGLAGGSLLWGAVAERFGVRVALLLAAGGCLVGLAVTARLHLPAGEGPNLAPSRHWPTPVVVEEPGADRGPVLVTVEYRIDPATCEEFARAMRDVRRLRLRDGAIRWDLLTDPADPGRFVESFLVESWIEHLRQHERVTVADRDVERRARRLHVGPQPPVVSHFIARELPR
jgi:MFS family permease